MLFLDTGHVFVREVQTEGNAIAGEYHWGDKLVIARSSNSPVAGINVECCVWHYAYSGISHSSFKNDVEGRYGQLGNNRCVENPS